jgi:DNA-directed RNA polymerase subunit beta
LKKIKSFIKKNYDLGKIGRARINKRIYKKFKNTKNRNLQPEDILGIVKYMLKANCSDNIDDLKNKRIRTASELIKNQIKVISNNLIKITKQKIEKVEIKIEKKGAIILNEIIAPEIITKELKNFFKQNQLSQIMEETNALSEITHKRKVSAFGIGAIDRKKANLNVREIHPSHFGRLCPIETSEGKNAGLILSLAKDIRLNKYGFIETPFYK